MPDSPPHRDSRRPVARSIGAVALIFTRPAISYASSSLLHMLLLGGLAIFASGDSAPSFSMRRGDGGMGDKHAPLGSIGGAELTAVFEVSLPAASAVEALAAIRGIEPLSRESVPETVTAQTPPPSPTSLVLMHERPEPVRDAVEMARVENETPPLATDVPEAQRAEQPEEQPQEESEATPKRRPRREIAADEEIGALRFAGGGPAVEPLSSQQLPEIASAPPPAPLATSTALTRERLAPVRDAVEAIQIESETPVLVAAVPAVERAEQPEERRQEEPESAPMLRRRNLTSASEVGAALVELPEVVANGRGESGAGTGAQSGDGNGGARGLAGGNLDAIARSGPWNPAPVYPELARISNMQGIVRIRVKIAADGKVTRAVLESSSGWQVLDDSAMAVVPYWRFEPARRGGVPIESEYIVPINFYLRRS